MGATVDKLTPRENWLLAARGGVPERIPVFPMDCNLFRPTVWDPDPETKLDFFGIRWSGNEFGAMPEDGYYCISEISEWHDVIKWPDLSKCDWEGMKQKYLERYNPDNVNIAMLNNHGPFLYPIEMLGWVEGLCALVSEPEEFKALVDRLTDFIVELLDYICKTVDVDIVFTGDDVCNTKGPFFSKDTWHEIFAPSFTRIIDAIHEHGALAEFHCCGNCTDYIDEFIAVGADICQLPMPNDALIESKKKYGNRLVITGGWDRKGPGNMPNASEETVRESVRVALDTYASDGALIFWDGGVAGKGEDQKNKLRWIYDEVDTYGRKVCARARKAHGLQ